MSSLGRQLSSAVFILFSWTSSGYYKNLCENILFVCSDLCRSRALIVTRIFGDVWRLAQQFSISNTSWPIDTLWRYTFGFALALVMARYPTVRSHYQNQCWLLIREVMWYSSESNFAVMIKMLISVIDFTYKTFSLFPKGHILSELYMY